MSLKKIILLISIFILIISALVPFLITNPKNNSSIISLIGTCIGVLGSIISIFIPNHYTFNFEENLWVTDGENGYKITIPSKKHGLGNSPTSKVFSKDGDSFKEVELESTHDKNGNITIGANNVFAGKVKIT